MEDNKMILKPPKLLSTPPKDETDSQIPTTLPRTLLQGLAILLHLINVEKYWLATLITLDVFVLITNC